jgi:hypothetical protein
MFGRLQLLQDSFYSPFGVMDILGLFSNNVVSFSRNLVLKSLLFSINVVRKSAMFLGRYSYGRPALAPCSAR